MSPADGIVWTSESIAQALCGLTRPAWKSRVKARLIEDKPRGAYDERQLMEIAFVGALRDHLSPRDTRLACQALKRNGRWDDLLVRARELEDDDRFDLVIEPGTRAVTLATDDASLVQAVRHPEDPRPVLVVSIADRLRRIRDGFRTIAVARERPQQRKVGRPARDDAKVLPIRPEP